MKKTKKIFSLILTCVLVMATALVGIISVSADTAVKKQKKLINTATHEGVLFTFLHDDDVEILGEAKLSDYLKTSGGKTTVEIPFEEIESEGCLDLHVDLEGVASDLTLISYYARMSGFKLIKEDGTELPLTLSIVTDEAGDENRYIDVTADAVFVFATFAEIDYEGPFGPYYLKFFDDYTMPFSYKGSGTLSFELESYSIIEAEVEEENKETGNKVEDFINDSGNKVSGMIEKYTGVAIGSSTAVVLVAIVIIVLMRRRRR